MPYLKLFSSMKPLHYHDERPSCKRKQKKKEPRLKIRKLFFTKMSSKTRPRNINRTYKIIKKKAKEKVGRAKMRKNSEKQSERKNERTLKKNFMNIFLLVCVATLTNQSAKQVNFCVILSSHSHAVHLI